MLANVSGELSSSTARASAFDKLVAVAAHGALHDAPSRTDESRCHQHTRTNVLDHLVRWAQGICDESASIFWLHGGAGAGKSAIMQTLAERCVALGLALGSFFFSRRDATRNSVEALVSTLVYQLAQSFPAAMQLLDSIIDREPLIFKKSLQVQLLGSLVPVLQHLVQLGIISDAPQLPRVFLIDGLDECNEPSQQQAIVHAVAAVCHEHRIPVKFLIASRPEYAISTSFKWYKEENYVLGTISLSEDPDAEADIRRFLEDEFLKLCVRHPFKRMIPSKWPSHYDINRLVWKSSSHFIYASTVMKYIWSAKESPLRSLQVILGLAVCRTTSPFAELDGLYHHIIGSAAHLDEVLQILAHCLYTSLPSLDSIICIMLNCSKEDLSIFMADMTPLMALSQSVSSPHEQKVKLLHASLGDFLRDQSRSGSLYLDEEGYLASKLERYFQLLDLHSRRKHMQPDWPASGLPYNMLKSQIFIGIRKSGHLPAAQEVLKRYRLRDFYQCQLRFKHMHQGIYDPPGPEDLSRFLVAVRSIVSPFCSFIRKSGES
ncbi:hypothetical protein D9619_011045 [Psilocybe cf. subviscida]|uniref:Nephrocystin 3-like N-terminal domain-containing protein n=1 Tax=Psilocybe cf. subviscida TaxID=2480587 RepID=A0A8H5B9J6_9AGAR|nr:hypothetical protein D9619_011045 [Psilocybe cf. subviscida]